MANVSFAGVDLSTFGFSLRGLNGRQLAGWKAERAEVLGREQMADLSGGYERETKTVLAGMLSSPLSPYSSHTHTQLIAALDALKAHLDPTAGFQQLVITGDNATYFRWARFSEMQYDEKFPIFKKPFEEIGLGFENLEPSWRRARAPLVFIAAPTYLQLPNLGTKTTRPKITMVMTGTVVAPTSVRLFTFTQGKNLIPNADFETSDLVSAAWVPTTTNDAAGLVRSATQARSGTNSLKMVRDTDAGGALNIYASVGPIQIRPSPTQYTLSGYFRAGSTTRNVQCEIVWYSDAAGGATISTSTGSSVSSTSAAWTRATVSATAPATAVSARLRFYALAAAEGEIHYVDDVQFEMSANVSAFELAHNALDISWAGPTLLTGDTLVIDGDALTVQLLRSGTSIYQDALSYYQYSPAQDDGFPVILKDDAFITNKNPAIGQVTVEYDELFG